MGEDVKLEVIRSTQDSLSKYIKKPPLTEKLLRKPPFRYLHDITTSIMRETGYLQGLYSQDELNPENIKDKEAKIVFLEKLIAAVNLSTGVNITARPNKIVAGLDVAKTNELLQAIAKALDKKVDSSEAVDLVLNKKSKGANQQSTSKKDTSKNKGSKDSKPTEIKGREPRTSDALKKKNKEKEKPKPVEKSDSKKTKSKKDAPPAKLSKVPSKEESLVEEAEEKIKTQDVNQTELPLSQKTVEESNATEPINKENSKHLEAKNEVELPSLTLADPLQPLSAPNGHQELTNHLDGDFTKEVLASINYLEQGQSDVEVKLQSDLGKEDKEEGENKPKSEEEVRRPQSARGVHRKKSTKTKPTPEVDNSNQSIGGEPSSPLVFEHASKPIEQTESKPQGERETRQRPKTAARPASARPGAPRVRDRGIALITQVDTKIVSEPVNLIVDTKDIADDDDHTLVTVEAPEPDVAVDQVADNASLLTGDQGHLVSQILETQKELEDTSSTADTHQKVDINWSSGRQRQQEVVVREVEKLCQCIQALTRAANPLGKLIDFLQEDIDSMQTELETWINTNLQLDKQLQAEQQLTEESIEPLARQLEDLDQLVEDQLEEISVVKATIIRNDERITKLLKSNHPHG